ncbi:hypothetical protein HK102_002352 [Quaeritorhiza haematococci]|nr:hypothetical protein HK102_002352 [Quaeritorhiza haematococci]
MTANAPQSLTTQQAGVHSAACPKVPGNAKIMEQCAKLRTINQHQQVEIKDLRALNVKLQCRIRELEIELQKERMRNCESTGSQNILHTDAEDSCTVAASLMADMSFLECRLASAVTFAVEDEKPGTQARLSNAGSLENSVRTGNCSPSSLEAADRQNILHDDAEESCVARKSYAEALLHENPKQPLHRSKVQALVDPVQAEKAKVQGVRIISGGVGVASPSHSQYNLKSATEPKTQQQALAPRQNLALKSVVDKFPTQTRLRNRNWKKKSPGHQMAFETTHKPAPRTSPNPSQAMESSGKTVNAFGANLVNAGGKQDTVSSGQV